MLIDWFTVGAQALNFVILVWLLKRFLYRPVLDAIDAREARIARQIADADEVQASALREQEDFKHRNETFDAQRAALLKQATDDADAERRRLMDAAREAADASTARRQDAERRDMTRLLRSLGDRTRDEVLAITRRALRDLGGTTLDERIADVFLSRLAALEPGARELLSSGLDRARPHATVRSAFELGAPQREKVCAAILATLSPHREELAGPPFDIDFVPAPDLVGGIELVVGGRKLGWNVSQYLDSFEQSLTATRPVVALNRTEATA